MKRIIFSVIASFVLAGHALADSCSKSLTGPFPAGQATKLCATFPVSSAINTDLLPATTNTYVIGSIDSYFLRTVMSAFWIFKTGADASGSTNVFYKTRGTSATDYTIVQSSDVIGSLRFDGSNGSGYSTAAQINGYVAGTPGASADMPGGLQFQTSPDGSATPATRWSINASGTLLQNNTNGGNIAINVSGTGIDGSGSGGSLLIRHGTGGLNLQNSSSNTTWALADTGDLVSNSTYGGNLTLSVAGKKLTVKGGGAAATSGQFTCNGTTGVVVATTSASTGMALAFSPQSISGTAPIGSPYVSALTAGTSFTVKCSVAGETSVYNWAMIGVS
jgi:hypothetical protein